MYPPTWAHWCPQANILNVCPPMRAHWRPLAITIELVLPSAYLSLQPKWQIDWFSHFWTVYGRKSLYLTMDNPFPQNCSFSWGIWTPSNSQMANRSVQPFCTAYGSVIEYIGATWRIRLKLCTLAPPGLYDWTCASSGPRESTTRTANWSVQPLLDISWQKVPILNYITLHYITLHYKLFKVA